METVYTNQQTSNKECALLESTIIHHRLAADRWVELIRPKRSGSGAYLAKCGRQLIDKIHVFTILILLFLLGLVIDK